METALFSYKFCLCKSVKTGIAVFSACFIIEDGKVRTKRCGSAKEGT